MTQITNYYFSFSKLFLSDGVQIQPLIKFNQHSGLSKKAQNHAMLKRQHWYKSQTKCPKVYWEPYARWGLYCTEQTPHCRHGLCWRVKSEYLNSRKDGGDFINIEVMFASLCKKQEKCGEPPDPPQASAKEQKSSLKKGDIMARVMVLTSLLLPAWKN